MRVEIGNNRQPRAKALDPVVAKTGVFAHLEDSELSPTELERDQRLGERDQARKARPLRIWLPRDMLRRITNLYKHFGKPRS